MNETKVDKRKTKKIKKDKSQKTIKSSKRIENVVIFEESAMESELSEI